MNSCPQCHQQAISVNQKLWLGPARSVACRHCGARLTVSIGPHDLIGIGASILPILLNTFFIRDVQLATLVWVIGFMIVFYAHNAAPLMLRTPEHEATWGVRPSVIIRLSLEECSVLPWVSV
jgi:hypothetical protein